MSSYKKLITNSMVFAIGRLGSKLISFFLVPVYTHYLSTAEYGTLDLVITTIAMLLPIISGTIYDAVLRFIMDKKSDRDAVITSALVIAFSLYLLSMLFIPILRTIDIFGDKNLVYYLYLILFFQIFESIFAEYTRAINEVKIFAINGILLSFLTGVLNIIFLVFINMKIKGYLISIGISYFVSIIFLIYTTKVWKNISLSKFDKKISRQLLVYSIPLIPNTLMFWIIAASSRFFVNHYHGVALNGLLAVGSKIPTVINLINQVFLQAWQLSAIEEYKSENKSSFYSSVFNSLLTVLTLGTSLLLMLLKPTFKLMFSNDFYLAWRVVPFLLLGAVFSSFSGFLGTNYIAAKHTKGVLKTSLISGLVSVLLNFLIIPSFGIVGAGISNMTSYIVMWMVRVFDTRKFVEIKINKKVFYPNFIIIFIQISIMYLRLDYKVEMIIQIIALISMMIINRKILKLLRVLTKKK